MPMMMFAAGPMPVLRLVGMIMGVRMIVVMSGVIVPVTVVIMAMVVMVMMTVAMMSPVIVMMIVVVVMIVMPVVMAVIVGLEELRLDVEDAVEVEGVAAEHVVDLHV